MLIILAWIRGIIQQFERSAIAGGIVMTRRRAESPLLPLTRFANTKAPASFFCRRRNEVEIKLALQSDDVVTAFVEKGLTVLEQAMGGLFLTPERL
jgi:hypothetical protein